MTVPRCTRSFAFLLASVACAPSGADGTLVQWGRTHFDAAQLRAPIASLDGYEHFIVLRTDGTVACMGRESGGNLSVPSGLGTVTAVAAGLSQSFALRSDGVVRAWGDDFDGDGTADTHPLPTDLGTVSRISAGADHAVAVRTNGTLRCWGNNVLGQCTVPASVGLCSEASASRRTREIDFGTGPIPVGGHTAAIRQSDKLVRCWGDNQLGQLVIPSTVGACTKVSAGYGHTVALRQDGGVRCWGAGEATDAPDGFFHFGQSNPPSMGPAVAIAAGENHSVAVLADGSVRCWGSNVFGQSTVPTGMGAAKAAIAGERFTVVLLQTGKVRIWGSGLPNQPEAIRSVAVGIDHDVLLRTDGRIEGWGDIYYCSGCPAVPPTGTFTAVSAGSGFGLGVKSDGTVAAWGIPGTVLTVPSDLGAVQQVDAGGSHAIALRANGTVRCWGSNTDGESNTPAGLTGVAQVSAGGSHSFIRRTNGTIQGWGRSVEGQITPPSGIGTVASLDCGGDHTVALRSDGLVRCFGFNGSGQCSVPAGLSAVARIAAGYEHSAALLADGSVRIWGADYSGELTVPAGLRNVRLLAVGYGQAIAIRATCTFDLSGDGAVSGADLGLLLGNWGQPGLGDFNADGSVTGADLGLLLGGWGPCP